MSRAVIVAWIAGGAKFRDCMVEDADTTHKSRVSGARIFEIFISQLFGQKATNELRKAWYTKLIGERRDIARAPSLLSIQVSQ